jgi:hypothetical protein
MRLWRSLSGSDFPRGCVGAIIAASLAFAGGAQALPLRSVEVEVEDHPTRAIGTIIRLTLTTSLRRELALFPIDAPPGARLMVRVMDVSLANDPGEDSSGDVHGMAEAGDAMQGEALIVDASGAVLRRKPIEARFPPSAAGAHGVPDSRFRRAMALSETLAYRIVRMF